MEIDLEWLRAALRDRGRLQGLELFALSKFLAVARWPRVSVGLRGRNFGTNSLYRFDLDRDFFRARCSGCWAPFECEPFSILEWTAVVGVFGRSVLKVIRVFCPFTIAYLHADLDLDRLALRLLFDLDFGAGPGEVL